MKRFPLIVFSGFVLSAGFFPSQTPAQDVVTLPYGYFTRSLPATGGEAQKSYVASPFSQGAIYVGKVATASATAITVDGEPWNNLILAASDTPHFLKIITGAQAGRFLNILSNTKNIVGLETSILSRSPVALNSGDFSVQPGDTIKIVPASTLASVFGDGSAGRPVRLAGGSSIGDADTVGIFDPATSRWERYYFHSSRQRWEQDGAARNCNTVKIPPDAGVEIVRGSGRPAVTLVCSGYVPEAAPRMELPGGPSSARLVSLSYPLDQTLGSLSYTGWKKNNSIFRADTLSVWNAQTGLWDTYYQRADDSWRKQGDNSSQNGVTVSGGVAVTILKRDPAEGALALPASPMPYVLE